MQLGYLDYNFKIFWKDWKTFVANIFISSVRLQSELKYTQTQYPSSVFNTFLYFILVSISLFISEACDFALLVQQFQNAEWL